MPYLLEKQLTTAPLPRSRYVRNWKSRYLYWGQWHVHQWRTMTT